MLSKAVDARAEAIEKVYRERYLAFRNALATVTGDRDSARDVVQEAFARALAERKQLRRVESAEAWIWKIALRLALRPEPKASGEPGVERTLDPQLPEPERDPDLARALRRLPPRRRLIFFLRYLADLPYAEIGLICGISEGTVAAALSEARAQLRADLDPPKPANVGVGLKGAANE